MQEGAERMRAFVLDVGREATPQLTTWRHAEHGRVIRGNAGAQRQRAAQRGGGTPADDLRRCHRVLEGEEIIGVDDR